MLGRCSPRPTSHRISPPALRYAACGEEDQAPQLEAFLADEGTTAPDVILDLLALLDVEAILGAGGLTGGDIAALRARLVGS